MISPLITSLMKHYFIDFEYSNHPLKNKKFGKENRKFVTGKVDEKLPKNYISTTKYNVVSFVPLNLMEQFSKLPNDYFLVSNRSILIRINNFNDQKNLLRSFNRIKKREIIFLKGKCVMLGLEFYHVAI